MDKGYPASWYEPWGSYRKWEAYKLNPDDSLLGPVYPLLIWARTQLSSKPIDPMNLHGNHSALRDIFYTEVGLTVGNIEWFLRYQNHNPNYVRWAMENWPDGLEFPKMVSDCVIYAEWLKEVPGFPTLKKIKKEDAKQKCMKLFIDFYFHIDFDGNSDQFFKEASGRCARYFCDYFDTRTSLASIQTIMRKEFYNEDALISSPLPGPGTPWQRIKSWRNECRSFADERGTDQRLDQLEVRRREHAEYLWNRLTPMEVAEDR